MDRSVDPSSPAMNNANHDGRERRLNGEKIVTHRLGLETSVHGCGGTSGVGGLSIGVVGLDDGRPGHPVLL